LPRLWQASLRPPYALKSAVFYPNRGAAPVRVARGAGAASRPLRMRDAFARRVAKAVDDGSMGAARFANFD